MSRNRTPSHSQGDQRHGRPPLSDADRFSLEFLAEQRVGIAPQLAHRLGVSVGAAQRRIRRLMTRGLMVEDPIFKGLPATVWITGAGLRAIGSPLPAPRVDLQGYRHDIGVGWLWLAAHDGAFGPLAGAISERRMRSADARLGRPSADPGQSSPYGVGVGGAGPTGLPQRHYPDALLELASGHRLALELELSAKGPRRLAGIMRGYAGDPRISSVLYLVPDRRLGGLIAAAARDAGIGELVHVELLAGGQAIAGAPAIRSRAVEARASERTASAGARRPAGAGAGAGAGARGGIGR